MNVSPQRKLNQKQLLRERLRRKHAQIGRSERRLACLLLGGKFNFIDRRTLFGVFVELALEFEGENGEFKLLHNGRERRVEPLIGRPTRALDPHQNRNGAKNILK